MTQQQFTDAATAALGQFGEAAHRAIALYREGGERIAQVAHERWEAAFAQARPQLDAETRKNARHAKDVFGRYWARALQLSTDGATIAVDTAIAVAVAGVERVAGYTPVRA